MYRLVRSLTVWVPLSDAQTLHKFPRRNYTDAATIILVVLGPFCGTRKVFMNVKILALSIQRETLCAKWPW